MGTPPRQVRVRPENVVPGEKTPSDYAPAAYGILAYGEVLLVDAGPVGGTSGSRMALDDDGRRWIVKHYEGDRDRIATELLANALYREAGIPVPKAGIGTRDPRTGVQRPVIIYPMIDGEHRTSGQPSESLADGFVMDALVANWDVFGLAGDNILWQGDVPIRLDQGGTFEFRAMGGRKDYGPLPVELETMLGRRGQARGTMAVTPELIQKKALEATTVLPPERVAELSSEAPFRDGEMRIRIRNNLNSRLTYLRHLTEGIRTRGL